ncbi:MAG: site-2 protease family protein, partial [Clostridiales bacterium]|nr:site-2 protease family protein [Clostridiales bacterium]
MFFIMASSNMVSTTVAEFTPGAALASVLQVGDELTKVGNLRTYTGNDVIYAIGGYGKESTNITVLRDGEKLSFDVTFGVTEEQGHLFGERDFLLWTEKAIENDNFGTLIKQSLAESRLMIRMVFDSLYDLITGEYGIRELSGPVGVTEVISSAAKEKNGTVWLYFVLIAMNLGVVNLIPLPALDGGRLFFMLIELVTRKRVPQNVEAMIHTVGIILLLIFMAIITFKDIIHLFR